MRKDGYIYRLPSEAEWEYACRAGSTQQHAGNIDEMGWYDANSGGETHPVGMKKPNAWGLYDMHGNVWELVQDFYADDYYAQSPSSDPLGPTSGATRVERGGAFRGVLFNTRSAARGMLPVDIRADGVGFRLVRTAQ